MITIKKYWALALVFSLILSVSVSGAELNRALVRWVVDGVTIEVETSDGSYEKVRYAGVELPEIPDAEENYRERAADYNRSLVQDKTVWLEPGKESRDSQDRLLAYVYLDPAKEAMVNAVLVARGYVKVVSAYPDLKYGDRLEEIARDARENGRGFWSEVSVDKDDPEKVSSLEGCIENLSSASREKFEEIVGIGEGIAERLVDGQPYGSDCGDVECLKNDLTEVYYVGDATAEEILGHFCPELVD